MVRTVTVFASCWLASCGLSPPPPAPEQPGRLTAVRLKRLGQNVSVELQLGRGDTPGCPVVGDRVLRINGHELSVDAPGGGTWSRGNTCPPFELGRACVDTFSPRCVEASISGAWELAPDEGALRVEFGDEVFEPGITLASFGWTARDESDGSKILTWRGEPKPRDVYVTSPTETIMLEPVAPGAFKLPPGLRDRDVEAYVDSPRDPEAPYFSIVVGVKPD